MRNKNFIRMLSFSYGNGKTLKLVQRRHDGTVFAVDPNRIIKPNKGCYIPAGDMLMLISFYQYVKSNDIQNDYINPYGRNKE